GYAVSGQRRVACSSALQAEGVGGRGGGHGSDHSVRSRLAERPAPDAANGVRGAMARARGAWSRIAAGRTGGRPDGYRWATHARAALHGIPAEFGCEWGYRFDGPVGGSRRWFGPRGQASRSDRSRVGRGGPANHLAAFSWFGRNTAQPGLTK